MRNPCGKACPDRTPGCCCEKRQAWLFCLKQEKKARKLPEGPERDNALNGAVFLKRIMDTNSPRSLSMCGGTRMPYNFAEGFVELANGHLIKGIGCFMKKIKVPKLPKEEQK